MKTLQIDSVAVFILATTKSFGGVTSMVSSYQSRMMEIAETWTKPMEHVYFVMGSNKFDDEFLKDECDYVTSFGDEPRAEAATTADGDDIITSAVAATVRRLSVVLARGACCCCFPLLLLVPC